jgi:3-hydroxybutyryl-CoA dehydrogenase
MDIKTIGVLGAGTMGGQIAQVAAQSGFNIVIRDVEERYLENCMNGINIFASRSVEKGKMTEEEKKGMMARIRTSTRMGALKDVDFIIEAIIEDIDIKKKAFAELDELTRQDVVLASNTSSLSLTELATAVKRQDMVVGMHFFNPAQLMRLVEVVRGLNTCDEAVAISMDLVRSFHKEPIEVRIDSPGFVVNRLMIASNIEAIRLYEQGIASKEDIDKATKLGLNYPMGPFELMDYTGLDINYYVMNGFHHNLQKELKWDPPLSIKNLVKAGMLGKKTGKGWYDYNKK